MEGGGSEESVAFGGAEAIEGEARDVAGISRELGCICVCSYDSRCLM